MYTMKETSQLTGLSYDTIKFYCNKDLVPYVKRDKNNYRIFDESMVNWLKSLSCLKNCEMSISEMKEYLDLCMEGPSTIPERKIMLSQKRENLIEKLKEIQEAIDYIDEKQQFYDDVLDEKIEYVSNLYLGD